MVRSSSAQFIRAISQYSSPFHQTKPPVLISNWPQSMNITWEKYVSFAKRIKAGTDASCYQTTNPVSGTRINVYIRFKVKNVSLLSGSYFTLCNQNSCNPGLWAPGQMALSYKHTMHRRKYIDKVFRCAISFIHTWYIERDFKTVKFWGEWMLISIK